MTTIRIPGVKSYTSHGTTYYYLRRTGKPIADPATGVLIDPGKDLAAFAARVVAMKAGLDAMPPPAVMKAGTLLDLIEAYRGRASKPGEAGRDPSPEWLALSQGTRTSYDRVLDPEKGYIRKAYKDSLADVPLEHITTPFVMTLRNKVNKISGFWFANYTVSVLRPLFGWANLYGHMTGNPAKGVPALDRPEGLKPQHISWADAEFSAMYDGAMQRGWTGIAMALALGRFAGWATADICHQPPAAWQDPRIVFVRRKGRRRGRVTNMQAPQELQTVMRALPIEPKARTLVTNEQGEPYTEDGLRSMIWRLGSDLADAGSTAA